MLSSITPLGERGRHSRWGLTVSALLAGAALGGSLMGAAAGALGWALLGGRAGPASVLALGIALAAGLALDLRIAGMRLPGVHRQVDEAWLRRYRGWVYGLGFGVQLGAGVLTIVVSSTVYVTFAAAALSASPATGALLGGAFGALRGLTVLPAGWARDPRRLMRLHTALLRWQEPARRAALALQLGLVVLAALAVYA